MGVTYTLMPAACSRWEHLAVTRLDLARRRSRPGGRWSVVVEDSRDPVQGQHVALQPGGGVQAAHGLADARQVAALVVPPMPALAEGELPGGGQLEVIRRARSSVHLQVGARAVAVRSAVRRPGPVDDRTPVGDEGPPAGAGCARRPR